MKDRIVDVIRDSISTKELLLDDDLLISNIESVVNICINTFKYGGKVLLCGNGGSAADAQHIAAELSGRFLIDREPLYAEALHVNSSYMTAVANDYGYDMVYERMVKAMCVEGDVLFVISTSGSSENIIKAAKRAKDMGVCVVGMVGSRKGKLDDYCDYILRVESNSTPRIQESHIMIGHIICELIESKYFNE
jgi:D-sedoheptulose 7-phosphate isomerase